MFFFDFEICVVFRQPDDWVHWTVILVTGETFSWAAHVSSLVSRSCCERRTTRRYPRRSEAVVMVPSVGQIFEAHTVFLVSCDLISLAT